MVEQRTLTPLVLVRVQVPQPISYMIDNVSYLLTDWVVCVPKTGRPLLIKNGITHMTARVERSVTWP